jgi:hypothetical protein
MPQERSDDTLNIMVILDEKHWDRVSVVVSGAPTFLGGGFAL